MTEDHRELLDAILKIPVKDNGEGLVPISDLSGDIIIDISQVGEPDPDRKAVLRKTAARMLAATQEAMPSGFRLKVWEAHRPMEKQEFMRSRYLEQLREQHPGAPVEELEKLRDRYVARPDIIPPHLTGGAVDLTVIGPDSRDLDMGTHYLEFGEATHTFSKNISSEAAKNRRILLNAMESVGFVNYEYEWWHFSYGDRYWAHIKNKEYSIFNIL